jgi:hypothetical protein
MTLQQSVIDGSPFNSLAFGKLLVDDLYSNINQTDNSTVFITPRYNTTGKTELKVMDFYLTTFFILYLYYKIDWCIITFYTKK